MDREQEPLKVAGVIGDPTRFAIYQYICTSGVQRVTAQEIAERFDLHPNVARLHLNKLRDVGLLEVHVEKTGRGGRPGTAYSLADRVLTLHFPPRDYQLLAELLSQALARMGDQGKQVLEEVGRSFGRRLADPLPAQGHHGAGTAAGSSEGVAPLDLSGPDAASGDRGVAPLDLSALPPEAVEEVARTLARHGVHAEIVRDEGGAVNLIMRNCSFKEVATHYPELVCQLCENIVRGVVDAHLHAPVHEEASLPRGGQVLRVRGGAGVNLRSVKGDTVEGSKVAPVIPMSYQTGEEAFGRGVIQRVPHRAHGAQDTGGFEPAARNRGKPKWHDFGALTVKLGSIHRSWADRMGARQMVCR